MDKTSTIEENLNPSPPLLSPLDQLHRIRFKETHCLKLTDRGTIDVEATIESQNLTIAVHNSTVAAIPASLDLAAPPSLHRDYPTHKSNQTTSSQ